ncbi:MAG: putative component of membrane protein insertase Oxa1/YidC/SpoIIIJ protein YidD [Marinoscillum sp.]|jgi:putative component of membrane protein insertase Oxa1/YidC/SpoIIIJ protein YidD
MKIVLIVFLSVCSVKVFSQDISKDFELIARKLKVEITSEKSGSFPFRFYKRHISKQILNDCIYDHSCSKFSGDVIEHFGAFKGLLLTADRLTRCNRASFAEIHPYQINNQNKAIDHWDDYAKKRP